MYIIPKLSLILNSQHNKNFCRNKNKLKINFALPFKSYIKLCMIQKHKTDSEFVDFTTRRLVMVTHPNFEYLYIVEDCDLLSIYYIT